MKRKRRCSESRCRPVQRRDYMWRGRKHGERTGVKHLPVCEAAASVSVMQQRLEDLIPGRLQSHLSLNTELTVNTSWPGVARRDFRDVLVHSPCKGHSLDNPLRGSVNLAELPFGELL
ncbi:uncharacterized protein LOC135114927 isoform X2 [Scylla paramamosain]|uniref:uncharacterized protein LOC135114927 isoform X2 n=1 Tax=Scylla paramamosain TaxID=85552 RepID=UPI003082A2CE